MKEYHLQHKRADDPFADRILLDEYVGKEDELAIRVIKLAHNYVNSLLESAEKGDRRVIGINLKWLNIPDAERNPEGRIASVYCRGMAVDKACPRVEYPLRTTTFTDDQ